MTAEALPDLRRLRYFHGQMLSADDLRREQDYFREKLRLRNRCEHGYGVVCGLLVEPVEPDYPCDPQVDSYGGSDADRYGGQPRVCVTAGMAVDCAGSEIVLARPCGIDLWRSLPPEERRRFSDGDCLYLSIAYRERSVEPTRAVYTDACGDTDDCSYGWTKETFRIRVATTPPAVDECADPCCSGCADPWLLLAKIDDVRLGRPLPANAVRMDVRRPFGRYRFTTITGISWTHGGHYSRQETADIVGTNDKSKGLVVRFSDGVRVASLRPGVVDIQVIEGGTGRNSENWFMAGDFRDLPDTGLTDGFRYCQRTDETAQRGDRVLVTVRTPFLLDHCCRPVDGVHVGGRVPILPGYAEGRCEPWPDPDPCAVPPSGIGPWTTGTGTGAGVFESWFYVD